MKKKVFKGVAGIAVLALLLLNVSVVRNGKRTTHFKLNSGETVFADDSDNSGSGDGQGSMFGTPEHYYGTNADGTRVTVVAVFDHISQGMNTMTSADIAAQVKADNPGLSGTALQAQVNARIGSIMNNAAQSSGRIEATTINIEGTRCPGWGGLCSEESVMDAQTRVLRGLRTGTSGR